MSHRYRTDYSEETPFLSGMVFLLFSARVRESICACVTVFFRLYCASESNEVISSRSQGGVPMRRFILCVIFDFFSLYFT